MHLTAQLVAHRPIITRACAFLVNIEIFRVVDIFVWTGLDTIDYPWLKIEKDSAGNVSCVVGLVEEDILAITTFRRKVFEIAILIDPMLLT